MKAMKRKVLCMEMPAGAFTVWDGRFGYPGSGYPNDRLAGEIGAAMREVAGARPDIGRVAFDFVPGARGGEEGIVVRVTVTKRR